MAKPAETLVGRERELASLDGQLEAISDGSPRIAAVTGEPGIGKSRLLAELARRADGRGYLVLEGRCVEFERDLPFAVFVDACDEYLASLDVRTTERLAGEGLFELATIFPSLAPLVPPGQRGSLVDERYRAHRAVSALLENLAVRAPVMLALDDVHWADEASAELLSHLVRRPPCGAVALVVAHRAGEAPPRLVEAVQRGSPEQLDEIALQPLTLAQASGLVDGLTESARQSLYSESGGNPFYFQQLARAPAAGAGRREAGAAGVPPGSGVPPAVAGSIGRELNALAPEAQTFLKAAALTGDPFELDLAAEIAEAPDNEALRAMDEAVGSGLVRPTEVPRRFAFRHPIVRRVLYEVASPGWRVGAHRRAAGALAARGAPALERAHHVEQSAQRGDEEAIALLREVGGELAARAPASAARWLGAALRLLPEHEAERRGELLGSLAVALAATGRLAESRQALLELLELLPPEAASARVRLAAACASVEHILGHHGAAHRRLRGVLDQLPDRTSPEAVALMIELVVDGFYVADYERMRDWALEARAAAGQLDNAPLAAAAAATLAWASAMEGDGEAAARHCSEAGARIHALSDDEVSLRIDALNWGGWGDYFIGRFHESLAKFERGIAVSQATAQGQFLLQLREGKSNCLASLGRVQEAIAVSEASIEAARLSGTPQALSWVLGGMCLWATYAGDLGAAGRAGEESLELARHFDDSTLAVVLAFDFAAYLVEAGQPERAVELALRAAGGRDLSRASVAFRSFHCDILTRAYLACGRQYEAEYCATVAGAAAEQVGWAVARAHAERARAAALLGADELCGAVDAALASADAADGLGARLDAGRARLLAGRALAGAGERARAVDELRDAEQTLHECGALRWRDEAGRELRKLGARVDRRGRGGQTAESGIASLSQREREIAELVWNRRTNPEIAAELFLSKKTVESHLRNIFRKLEVSTRVELARAIERARHSEG